jgi:hypothetical protein
MTTIRNLLLAAGSIVLAAACGGSDNGDVTIRTDDKGSAAPGRVIEAQANRSNDDSKTSGQAKAPAR